MLDILLVNPGNRLSQFGGVSKYATVAQPLGLAMLAAYIRGHNFSVEILDSEVLDLSPEETVDEIVEHRPKFVGFTVFTTKMTAANEILELLRKRAPYIKTIIGGHHCSAIPEETLAETKVDFVVKGEGYKPLVDILNGRKEPIQIAEPMKDINELPLPAWDLLAMDKYRAHHWQTWGIGQKNSFALVYTSLGCPFQCKFCSVSVVYGKRIYRQKSPERVMQDFDVLYNKCNIKHIEIIDDTFTLNKKHVEGICDLLIERKYDFNMWAFSRTDTADPYLLEKMKKAGINWVFMGVEAGNKKILDSVLKKQNLEQIRKAVEISHQAGMNVGTNYIFGLAEDDFETMQDTLDLALELNTEWSNFFIAMPYPGTEMYYKADAKDLPEKWEQYGFFAPSAKPLPTKHVSSEDVVRFRDKAFKTFFSSAKYQEMIERKFGMKKYIQDMLKKKIGRDYERIQITDVRPSNYKTRCSEGTLPGIK